MLELEDECILFVRALEEHEGMMKCFLSLKNMPVNARASVLSTMVLDMRDNDEDAKIIRVIASLKKPEMYNRILKMSGV